LWDGGTGILEAVNQELFSFRTEAAAGLRPSFLCIGQPHAGIARLGEMLSGHAQIGLPHREGDYFCFNYHKGERWYLERFAGVHDGIRRIGEVGPMYLYSDLAPSRIAAFGSIRKFVVMLRDPVSWLAARYAVIHSRHVVNRASFLEDHGHEFDRLCVHSFLMLYLALFDRDCFLFATTDELTANEELTTRRVAAFLEIDPNGFVRRDRRPRFPSFASFLSREPEPPAWLFEELRARRGLVNEQTERLGAAIGRDLSGWLID
jgi:hypothetical protein